MCGYTAGIESKLSSEVAKTAHVGTEMSSSQLRSRSLRKLRVMETPNIPPAIVTEMQCISTAGSRCVNLGVGIKTLPTDVWLSPGAQSCSLNMIDDAISTVNITRVGESVVRSEMILYAAIHSYPGSVKNGYHEIAPCEISTSQIRSKQEEMHHYNQTVHLLIYLILSHVFSSSNSVRIIQKWCKRLSLHSGGIQTLRTFNPSRMLAGRLQVWSSASE